MKSRSIHSFVLLALIVLAGDVSAAPSSDPRVSALQALRAASRAPLTGSTEAGAVHLVGCDVDVPGATPVQQARSFLAAYGAAFELTGPDQQLGLRGLRSQGSLNVVSFAQTYKRVPVFAGEMRVGVKPAAVAGMGRVVFAGGALLPDQARFGGLDTDASVPPAGCVEAARAHLGRPGAGTLADPRLMIYDARLLGGAPGPHLVWALTLGGGDPRQVFCDAQTAAVVFDRAFAAEELDLWMGLQYPNPSHTYIGDEDGLEPEGQSNTDAVLEFGYIHTVYEFFADLFGWRGTAGNDNPLQLLVDADTGKCGRFFYDPFGEAMQIDTGCASFDVTAHEYTHGIINHSSGLVYNGVPGAINESYADTMGIFVDDLDWLLGEDRSGDPGNPIRNFQSPPDEGQPDRLSDQCTDDSDCNYSGDSNGVHTNSGILNKAHYLISEGGPWNGLPFTGIGRFKMGVLTFVTMHAVPSGASFQDVRQYSIETAKTLASDGQAGFVTSDVCAVRNAFASVEIGPGDFDCDGIEDNWQDPDGDFLPNSMDNCPAESNPEQTDMDGDGIGNHCDGDFDNDGIPNGFDNCNHESNWDQLDADQDGVGNACDFDSDNDGIKDNGDASVANNPCANGDTEGCDDNCRFEPNPDQIDGNNDGFGDACDPDLDTDGLFVLDDNCTFVSNPEQQDSDGDGLGDACDKCPDVADWDGTYIFKKWIMQTPVPSQPDSDGDGTPDACDRIAFDRSGLELGGASYNPVRMVRPGDGRKSAVVTGPEDSRFRIPLPLCDPDGDPDASLLTEVVFVDLDATVDGILYDDDGLALGSLRPGPTGSSTRGLRVTPDCARTYFLEISLGRGFAGSDAFAVESSLVPSSSPNPWRTPGSDLPPPGSIGDADGDGLPDFLDSCPTVADPTGADIDADGVGDACDNCGADANSQQEDADGDRHGDVCDCAPADAGAFAPPGEVTGVAFDADGMTLRWDPAAAGPATVYDLLRGEGGGPVGGSGAEACLAQQTPGTSFPDPTLPSDGQMFWYVVRARNTCGVGTYGSQSNGAPSLSLTCP